MRADQDLSEEEKRRSSFPVETGEGSAVAASAIPTYLLTGDVDDIPVSDCCGQSGGFKR